MTKETFKEAMQIFREEFRNCFSLGRAAKYDPDWYYYRGYEVGDKLRIQMMTDLASFSEFIESRMNDELLDKIVADGILTN